MQKIRVRKRGKTYSYAFEAGKKPDGRRNPIEKGGFATKAEAYNAGIEAYNSWKHGNIGITSEKVTLADFLDSWLERHVKGNVRPLTYDSYYYTVNSRIKDYIGSITVQELTPEQVDNWLIALSKEYTKKTISLSRTVLSTALKYAVYPCKLITSNPVQYIKLPRVSAGHPIERKIITDDDIHRIFAVYHEETFINIFVLIARYTGMRVSEVCGLEWKNIDFETNTINVVQQLQQKYGKVRICPPKSDTSERKILLDRQLVKAIQAWRKVQAERRDNHNILFNYYNAKENKVIVATKNFVVPEGYRLLDLVITSTTGHFATTSTINDRLRPLGFNTHSFRHTHATKLAEIGVIGKAIAYRLGHSDTKITDELYTHHTDEMAKNLVEKMEEKMEEKCRQNENVDKMQTN